MLPLFLVQSEKKGLEAPESEVGAVFGTEPLDLQSLMLTPGNYFQEQMELSET